MRTHTLTIILAALLLIAGCGQKGPLFLPAEPEAQSSTANVIAEGEVNAAPTGQEASDQGKDDNGEPQQAN